MGGLLGSSHENLILGLSLSTPLIQFELHGEELLRLYVN